MQTERDLRVSKSFTFSQRENWTTETAAAEF